MYPDDDAGMVVQSSDTDMSLPEKVRDSVELTKEVIEEEQKGLCRYNPISFRLRGYSAVRATLPAGRHLISMKISRQIHCWWSWHSIACLHLCAAFQIHENNLLLPMLQLSQTGEGESRWVGPATFNRAPWHQISCLSPVWSVTSGIGFGGEEPRFLASDKEAHGKEWTD